MTEIPVLAGTASIADRYRVWLCDIWGVLHNGVSAYPAACQALTRYRGSGGTVVLITNAPRPAADIQTQISELGVPPTAYDAIVTSGDVTRSLIAGYGNRNVFHLGPPKDLTLYAGLEVRLTPVEKAEAVVCTGLFNDLIETPANYAGQLAAMHARGLPMICANPDIVVERGSAICYCAGALGEAYEDLGGRVAYAGKPKQPIYDAAMARASQLRAREVAKSEILAIGDGLKTDILGAHDNGIDVPFVASAIHLDAGTGLTAQSLGRLFPRDQSRPLAAIERLAW